MNILLVDSHFHDWDNPVFPSINAGCTCDDLPERVRKYSAFDFVYLGAAMGPWEAKDADERKIDAGFGILVENIKKYDPLFIGETGLDYYWNYGTHNLQISLFERQMDLAAKLGKRVLIHSRQACDDTCTIIKEHSSSKAGVIHCCDGNPLLIETALSKGYWISFAGNLTYKNNGHLREALKTVPKNRLLLETDSPYLSPVPFRGKPNTPDYIANTYAFASDVLGIDLEELTALVYSNFRAFVAH